MKYRRWIHVLDTAFAAMLVIGGAALIAGVIWALLTAPPLAQKAAIGGIVMVGAGVAGGRFTRDRVDPGGATPRQSFD